MSIDSISIILGQTMELAGNAIPSNYNEKSFNLIWESSDEDIVTIDDRVKLQLFILVAEITVSVADKPSVKKVIPVEVMEILSHPFS